MNPQALHKHALKIGIHFHKRNEFQNAFNAYSSILTQNPQDVHALHLTGILLLQCGFSALGKQYVNQAIAVSGNLPEAEHNLSVFDHSEKAKVLQEFESLGTKSNYTPLATSNIGAWRMGRMLEFAPVFASQDDTWLTIGDSMGHDSMRLKRFGIQNVIPSNLQTLSLQEAQAKGDISEYLEINAEDIKLEDASFDYILCKEALHHMPRPYKAIYEMLRVCKKGVVFIEPHDPVIDYWPPKPDVSHHRIITGGDIGNKIAYVDKSGAELLSKYIDWYEDHAFNYVYTLSKREIRKIALGMGLPSYATKCFHDFYLPEYNDQPAIPESEAFQNTVEQIQRHTLVSQGLGLPYSYISGMLFKETPAQESAQKLNALGFEFTYTPTIYIPLKFPNP